LTVQAAELIAFYREVEIASEEITNKICDKASQAKAITIVSDSQLGIGAITNPSGKSSKESYVVVSFDQVKGPREREIKVWSH
jgi:hypothetical protein